MHTVSDYHDVFYKDGHMECHNWHLMMNIDKHTTSYNMYCPYFFIRSILNIMCDSLNTLCCSFLITRSVFVIMRCRSYRWCSSLIITCCAFINCRATCYFMYSRYNIICSIPLIIRCSKFITCCGYIFQYPTITPVNCICRDQSGKIGTKIRDQITIV